MQASCGMMSLAHGMHRWKAGQVLGTLTVVLSVRAVDPNRSVAATLSNSKTSSGDSASVCACGRHDSVRGRVPLRAAMGDVRKLGDVAKSACALSVADAVRDSDGMQIMRRIS